MGFFNKILGNASEVSSEKLIEKYGRLLCEEGDHARSLESTQPSSAQMGKVGEGLVQNGRSQMAEATV
jgi:hypothetical protein